MHYKLPLSKLDKLFNPFLYGNTIFFGSQDIIKEYIEKNDIFTSDIYVDSNLKIKEYYINENYIQYKKLAYEIANYEPKKIVIELKEDNFTDIESIIPQGLLNLYAAFYKSTFNDDSEEVIVQIDGSEKVIKSLLGNDIDNYLTEEKVSKTTYEEIVYYEVPNMSLEENWGSSSYVLQELDKISFNNQSVNLNLVLQNVWEDKVFIKNLFKKPRLVEKTKEYILNDSFYEILKEDKEHFSDYWRDVLSSYQDDIREVTKADYDNQKEIYELLKNKEYREDIEEEKYFNSKKTMFYYNIQQEFFENTDNLIYIMKKDNKWAFRFYETASFETRFDEKVLNSIYNDAPVDERTGWAKTVVDPHHNLNQEQYNDYNYMKKFLTNYATKMDFHRIFSIVKTRGQITDFNKIVSSFINDKEKVLDLMNTINDKTFTRIYMLLPSKLKEDKDIIKTVLSQDINLYLDVPMESRQEYKRDFILNAHHDALISEEFRAEDIINITEKPLLEKLLKEGNVSWLKTINCPLKWKQDSSLLDLIENAYIFSSVEAVNPLYETILNNKNFLKKVVTSNKNFYDQLPEKIQDDKDLLEIMAKVHSYIPNKNFSSRKLCLEALLVDMKYIVLIPKPFWYEKEFVLGVARLVDQNLITKDIFQQNHAPKELIKLLSISNIKKDYEDFLSSYFTHQKLEDTIEEKKVIKKKKL